MLTPTRLDRSAMTRGVTMADLAIDLARTSLIEVACH